VTTLAETGDGGCAGSHEWIEYKCAIVCAGEKTISVEALNRIAQALNVRMAKLVEKL
jgi:hypothetical protein